MAFLNENYLKLQAGYLFPEIERRVAEFLKEKPEAELTDEHIFPAALGGTLVIENGSCTTCNNGCSKFEQAVATELTPLRNLLQIPDRRGEVPHTHATVKVGEKEYEGRVAGDGRVQLKRVVTELVGLLAGIFMLRGHNWARWLAVAWMAFHVAISFPEISKLAIHSLLCAD